MKVSSIQRYYRQTVAGRQVQIARMGASLMPIARLLFCLDSTPDYWKLLACSTIQQLLPAICCTPETFKQLWKARRTNWFRLIYLPHCSESYHTIWWIRMSFWGVWRGCEKKNQWRTVHMIWRAWTRTWIRSMHQKLLLIFWRTMLAALAAFRWRMFGDDWNGISSIRVCCTERRNLVIGIRLTPILAIAFMYRLKSTRNHPFPTVYLYCRYINDIFVCAYRKNTIGNFEHHKN